MSKDRAAAVPYFLPDEAVHRMCTRGRVDDVILHIQASLQSGPSTFKTLQIVLSAVLFSKMDDDSSLAFVLDCVEFIEAQGSDAPPAVAHLLLELIPGTLQVRSDQVNQRALGLFTRFCTPATARIALKLAQAFRIQWASVVDQEALLEYVQELLVNKASMASGVGLAMHFKEVDQYLDCKALLAEVVGSGLESLAERWAALLGRDYQIVYIEQCVAYGRLKSASKAVRGFQLAAVFPDVDNLYRERTLARLLERRQWGVAATFAGVDVRLQTTLVRTLSMEGEGLLAQEYARLWGLPLELARPDPAELAAELARRAATYLQLQLPPETIHFVNSVEGVATAEVVLREAQVVGLDVEWKPFTEKGAGEAPASILQVAAHDQVFIFDLIRLSSEPSLDACLTALMASAAVQKLGLELTGDLRKLAGSYPRMRAFQRVEGVVDVRQVWLAVCRDVRKQVLGMTVKGLSLSKLANELLGRPLDKSMQVSDWEARPLSPRQLTYAAMDAHCLLLMRQRLLELSPGTAPGHFQAAACSFQAGPRPSSTPSDTPDDNEPPMPPPASPLFSPAAPLPSPANPSPMTPAAFLPPSLAARTALAASGPAASLAPPWRGPSPPFPHQQPSLPAAPAAAAAPPPPPPPQAAGHPRPAVGQHGFPADGATPQPLVGQPAASSSRSTAVESQSGGVLATDGLLGVVPAAVRRALEVAGLEGALLALQGLVADGASVAAPADAAAALGVPLERIGKAVALVAKSRRVVVVARGHHRLAPRKAGWLKF